MCYTLRRISMRIGIVLMSIRIRIRMWIGIKMKIRIRIRIGMKTMPMHITACETINPGFDLYSVGGAGTVKQCAYFEIYSKEDIQNLACHMTYCRLFSTDVTVGTRLESWPSTEARLAGWCYFVRDGRSMPPAPWWTTPLVPVWGWSHW